MKYGGGMNELPYPSDLTVAQWALIEPLLPAPKPKGRKRRVDLRKITNAILYVLKGGISWRMLPREFAPWKTVYHYFRLWRLAGLWDGWSIRWSTCGMGGEDGSVCARYRLQTKGTDWLFRFAMALDRGANLRMAGQLPSPCSGLRDQSTHERGLDQNRHDPPYGAKARLSILRQLLSTSPMSS